MTGFALPVDDDVDLVLREEWTWPIMHRLTLANLDHLRPWEPWASDFPAYEQFALRCRQQLIDWTEGRDIPTAIRYRGTLVGALGARPNAYFNSADIGYWLDASHQGQGIVTRAVATMIDYLFAARGIARIELQTMTTNGPSRALAERLGFQLEGIRRSAFPVGGVRYDEAVYGLLPGV